ITVHRQRRHDRRARRGAHRLRPGAVHPRLRCGLDAAGHRDPGREGCRMSDDTPKSASPTPPWQPPLPPLPAPQASEAPRVPGLPRTSYGQPPTAPTPASITSGPAEVGTDDEPTGWEPAPIPEPHRTGLSGWALLLATLAL